MLFNSYAFIFLFLPFFLAGWQFTGCRRPQFLLLFLLAASIIFYAFWGISWLILLTIMIGGNYLFGLALTEALPDSLSVSRWFSRRAILVCGLVFNLLPLLWFKYSWFLIRNLALLFQADWQFTPPPLPMGISFYTFIQIAWLAGIYRGQFEIGDFRQHAAFSFCFPYIISGPIVRQEQIGWQLERVRPFSMPDLASGFTLFAIGLAKKVLLADSLGFYADAVFNAAEKNWPLSGMEAWAGSFCYTFQLYFDFSGYTDMALGIGLMIGLKLPENFNSPYRSTGIIDFWRRWHITLSSWLRDFLYIPLGGNRRGKARQYLNLFLTMLIGGAWHGAGWTYALWGAMHGGMLCVNHFFRASVRKHNLEKYVSFMPCRVFSIMLTFLLLNFCWVIFRAPSLDTGLAIYQAMFNGPFYSLPISAGGGAQAVADIFAILAPNHYFSGWRPMALLAISLGICWFCPTSRQIIHGEASIFSWRPTPGWSLVMAALTFCALALLSRQSTFLYFQF